MSLQNYSFILTCGLLLLTTLVGGFSLSRVAPAMEDVGILGELRYVLCAILIVVFFIRQLQSRALFHITDYQTWRWVLSVCLLHFYILASSLWTPQSLAVSSLIPDIALLIVVLFIAYFLFSEAPIQCVRFILFLSLVIGWLLILVNLLLYEKIDGEMYDIGIGGIGYSRILSVAVVASIYQWMKTGRILWLFGIPFFITSIFLSGSRGAVFALLVSLMVLLLMNSFWVARNILWISLVGFVAWLLRGVSFIEESTSYFWSSLWLAGNSNNDLYLADRDVIFQDAIDGFFTRPVFGNGLGAFEIFGRENYPHNIILNIAVDGGTIGLFLASIPFLMLIWRYRKPRILENNFAFGLAVFYFVNSMFTGTYYDARFLWVFMMLFMFSMKNNQEMDPKLARIKNF